MKIRHIVFSLLTVFCLVTALALGGFRALVTSDNTRDFAAESFRGDSEEKYVQLAAYLDADDYLTPDGMMELSSKIESALTDASVKSDGNYLLSASVERDTTVSRETLSIDVNATVYFGDWFLLHPDIPIHGGYLDESDATVDFCVIDDLCAWRIFGSTDVCGMEIEVDSKTYTVSAVTKADRGVYAPYYGEKPRVYILYSSASVRDERIVFTSLESVLPSPLTDFAKSTFTDAVSQYTDEVHVITDRFAPLELFGNIRDLTRLGVMEGRVYPYYENVARIMETKCAVLLAFETFFYVLFAIFLITLTVLIFRPIIRSAEERRILKKKRAFYT